MIETTAPLPLRPASSAGPGAGAAPGLAPQPDHWQTEASTPGHAGLTRLRSLGADTAYVLVSLPWTLVGFVLVLAGLAVALPLMVLGVGLPLAVAMLAVARWFAGVERVRGARRAGLAGDQPLRAPLRPQPVRTQTTSDVPRPSLPRRVARALSDVQSWRDVVHALTAWVVATVTFSVTLTWWVGAAAGVTAFAWDQYLPASSGAEDFSGAARDVLEVLNSTGFRLGVGIVLLLTLLPMTRAMARLQVGFARTLLEAPGGSGR
ncbi:hypothetical protein Sked_27380 [Sanguibacter keddieii DSM 10542]|uniref:Putative sensor domain-containing protein n=1 Tax=Sanguibacter keddieii (strain ATCC 51767 / DSM 10542 / NCFB 3025 / ST-74) TaxID=446469 RepID=D1BAU1_SANKS|nr:sensor domain-containing protein [Sanguibacter keddieii]ACZ22642.1 hypothetical protein Sked_27380 [Sanguibacter keddieii DSM 10542]